MRKGYKVAIALIIFLLVISSSLGSSYALWTKTVYQGESNQLTTGCFVLKFNDTDEEEKSTKINLNNTYPIADAKGMTQKPYKLTIKNECNTAADYNLYISTFLENSLSDEFIRIYLHEDEFNNVNVIKDTNSFGPQNLKELTKSEINEQTKQTVEKSNSQIATTYTLNTGILYPNETNEYQINLWLSENATKNEMGKTFNAAIFMEALAHID